MSLWHIAGFVGADILTFPTLEDSFKWTPRTLHKALENKKMPVSFKFSNCEPNRAVYREEEIIELIEVIKSHQAKLILDHIFHGLEFDSTIKMTKIGKVLNEDFEWVIFRRCFRKLLQLEGLPLVMHFVLILI